MFERIVCLSVDKRIGEQQRIAAEVATLGGQAQFFLAGDGTLPFPAHYDHIDIEPPARSGYPAWSKRPNSYNAFLCFRAIIAAAQRDGVATLLLLEDDVTFVDSVSEVLASAWEQLWEHDSSWQLFYLGANHSFARTRQVSANLLQVNGSGCFHAVALRSTVFTKILELPLENPIDGVVAKRVHPEGSCYACWPNVAVTRPGFSYCEGREVDYTQYFANKGC